MSLEDKVQHVVQEMQGLTNAITQLASIIRAQPLSPQPPKTGRQPAASAVQGAPAAAAAPKKEEPKAPTYDTVKSAILQLAQEKGREAAVTVLAKFGATSGKDLKPEQYEAALNAIREYGADSNIA